MKRDPIEDQQDVKNSKISRKYVIRSQIGAALSSAGKRTKKENLREKK